MIQAFKEYIIILTTAALICCILLLLYPTGMMNSLLKVIFGVFLIVAAISPWREFKLPDSVQFLDAYNNVSESAVDLGINMAEKERIELIKAGLETYIIDSAEEIGYQINVYFEVNQTGIPISVQLKGDVPLTVKKELSKIITNDLGIPKENQRWIGETGKNELQDTY